MRAERLDKHPPCTGAEAATAAPGGELARGTVHLWIAHLPPARAEQAACEAVLSPEERRRAEERRSSRDRNSFVAVRGMLRRLLALYCGRAPEGLCFGYGPTGKPFLRDSPFGLSFNVSHAGDLAVLAFSRDAEVGVDVERLRRVPRADRIAARMMTPERAEHWRLLPADERALEFMREWTRLEAFSKLTGDGVWKTLIAGGGVADVNVTWFRIDPAPGYIGSLAVGARQVQLRTHRWPADLDALAAGS